MRRLIGFWNGREGAKGSPMWKRRPYLRYCAGLLCVGVVFFASSFLTAGYALSLGVVGLAFILAALAALMCHEIL